MVRSGGPALAVSLLLASSTSSAQPASQPGVALYVYPEDPGAAGMSSRVANALNQRAGNEGWRVFTDPRIAELLDRSPEDLVRAADALVAGRAAYADGVEQNSRLRLEQAQEALLKARASFLEANAAPPYSELRNCHLYLAIIALNLGQADISNSHFRQVAFLGGPRMELKTDVFPPSVVEAFNRARGGLGTGAKGSLRIESDVKGATILIDGFPKGPAPRTLNDIPEGQHYVEVRAPGASPKIEAIDVLPGIEAPVVMALKATPITLRHTWDESRGEQGGAAIARILQQDRFVIASVRTTVAGVSPYAIRGATFDGEGRRRLQMAEAATARDQPTTEQRIQKFSETVFRVPKIAGVSIASIAAKRARILDRESALVTVETGAALQVNQFDGKGNYVSADRYASFGYPYEPGFNQYLETRTALHIRYGLRERTTVTIDVPFFTKNLTMDFDENDDDIIQPDEEDVERDDVGVGDITLGADVRLPGFEKGPISLAYVSTRVKLPTGNSFTPSQHLRQYDTLVMGTGQYDVYAGLGIALPRENFRSEVEVGYLARLPDRVSYYNFQRARRHLNPGDEERIHTEFAMHMSRALAPELYFDFRHRHATQDFIDPITHDDDEAREMFLLNAGFALRAELSEKANAGVVFEHPLWGKSTATFHPLDVVGPRLFVYYGRRF